MPANNSKEKVFILTSKYEDEDSEIVGAYDDMQALCDGFGELVVADISAAFSSDSKSHEVVKKACDRVAKVLARTIPVLCRTSGDLNWVEDECTDGNGTVFGLFEEYRKRSSKCQD